MCIISMYSTLTIESDLILFCVCPFGQESLLKHIIGNTCIIHIFKIVFSEIIYSQPLVP